MRRHEYFYVNHVATMHIVMTRRDFYQAIKRKDVVIKQTCSECQEGYDCARGVHHPPGVLKNLSTAPAPVFAKICIGRNHTT